MGCATVLRGGPTGDPAAVATCSLALTRTSPGSTKCGEALNVRPSEEATTPSQVSYGAFLKTRHTCGSSCTCPRSCRSGPTCKPSCHARSPVPVFEPWVPSLRAIGHGSAIQFRAEPTSIRSAVGSESFETNCTRCLSARSRPPLPRRGGPPAQSDRCCTRPMHVFAAYCTFLDVSGSCCGLCAAGAVPASSNVRRSVAAGPWSTHVPSNNEPAATCSSKKSLQHVGGSSSPPSEPKRHRECVW